MVRDAKPLRIRKRKCRTGIGIPQRRRQRIGQRHRPALFSQQSGQGGSGRPSSSNQNPHSGGRWTSGLNRLHRGCPGVGLGAQFKPTHDSLGHLNRGETQGLLALLRGGVIHHLVRDTDA